uniref:Uncharacterized protein n=1 Tax=Arundo donax TaxID=35708 RepID=A0A0A9GU82_ARUDO
MRAADVYVYNNVSRKTMMAFSLIEKANKLTITC